MLRHQGEHLHLMNRWGIVNTEYFIYPWWYLKTIETKIIYIQQEYNVFFSNCFYGNITSQILKSRINIVVKIFSSSVS